MLTKLTLEERKILAMLTYARLGNSFSPHQIKMISNLIKKGLAKRIVREGDVFYEAIMSPEIREMDKIDYKNAFSNWSNHYKRVTKSKDLKAEILY